MSPWEIPLRGLYPLLVKEGTDADLPLQAALMV